ncbi:recombination regulator RecX [Rodentibacter caecimuris]|uniref:Regulatory protein RecX n=1 Tax=Rodentibacter caecimuris TaxID=1796644 RepID=A0ABX3KWC4_9PAST|nr:recombination regulator RecX [Rodentibacter heylii]
MSSVALSYVINLLARREYSEFELRNKMQEKAFSELEIDEVIAHCQQKNWQNDKRFAENYLRYRSQRGYGLNRIRQELKHLKGIQSDIINEVLVECDIDWSKLALIVLCKKFPYYEEKHSPKVKQKIWNYMLSHGFSPDQFLHFIDGELEIFE